MVRIINFVLCNYNQGGLSAPLARYNGEFLYDGDDVSMYSSVSS